MTFFLAQWMHSINKLILEKSNVKVSNIEFPCAKFFLGHILLEAIKIFQAKKMNKTGTLPLPQSNLNQIVKIFNGLNFENLLKIG